MAHFGLLTYEGSGHLNPLFALSRRLVAHGHRVTVFLRPSLEQQVLQQGLEFFPIEIAPHRRNHLSQEHSRRIAWINDLRSRVEHVNADMLGYLDAYPEAIRAAGVDSLLIGEISLAGPTVAEILRIPYVLVSTTIPHNFGWHADRSLRPNLSLQERLRRHLLEVSVLRMHGPIRQKLDQYRKGIGLKSIRTIENTFPARAHITQWPQCLETPRSLPSNFRYTGPFVDERPGTPTDFPWKRLDGRPLVYASLGTTRKGDLTVLQRVADACERLDFQVVLTHGGRSDSIQPCNLPPNAIAVSNAPQLELLEKATLVVTHAGPNTALETLRYGKPMLALPITLDQPAVATALVRTGAAIGLSPKERSTEQIVQALRKLHEEKRYRQSAAKLRKEICSRNRLEDAVRIIEESFSQSL